MKLPATMARELPPHIAECCRLAMLESRMVLVWVGVGSMPREVLAKFGNKAERAREGRP